MKNHLHLYVSNEAMKKLKRAMLLSGMKPSAIFEEMIDIEHAALEMKIKIAEEAEATRRKEEARAINELTKERMKRHETKPEYEDFE